MAVRFFDICFKQGVLDAYKFADDFGARDFLERHKEAWDFGVLGEPDDYDWELWRFTLYRWCRANHLTSFARDYIYSVTRKNHHWYLLPFCMRFYLLGVEEWLEYPEPRRIEIFKKEPKVHWAPREKGLRKMMTDDFISYMQDFVYQFRRSPLSQGEDRVMVLKTMDSFCQAIHTLTRKYVTGKKFRAEN